MVPLVSTMVQDDMAKRPTMDGVMRQFDQLVQSRTELQLRSRVVYRKEVSLFRPFRWFMHWIRQARYKIQGLSAIPTPWL
jgi:hypothetical protein